PSRVARDRGHARERLVVRDERPPRAQVAYADAVVYEGMALPLGVPGRDGIRPDLQLERGRHTVVSIVAVALGILPVHVEIDEPGRNAETGDGECLACRQRLYRDRRNPAALDAHVARRVQACLGVEYAPACEDKIVLGVARSRPAGR